MVPRRTHYPPSVLSRIVCTGDRTREVRRRVLTHRRRASSTYLGPMPNVTIDEVEYRRLTDDRAYLTRRVHELTDEVDALKDALRRAKASSNAVTHGRRAPRSRGRA